MILHRPGAEDPAGQKAPRAAPELEKLTPSAAMQHLPELQVTPQPLASSAGCCQPSERDSKGQQLSRATRLTHASIGLPLPL